MSLPTPCAFVSRHEPTAEQRELALKAGFHLTHVGDADAFNRDAVRRKLAGYRAAAVVHPAALVNAMQAGCAVLVFENGQRAAEGGPSSFYPKAVHVFTCDGNAGGHGWPYLSFTTSFDAIEASASPA